MAPVNIPLPLRRPPAPSTRKGRLVNCYAEPLGKTIGATKGMPTPAVVWRKSPGLTQFAASSNPGFRGGILVGGTQLYTAWNEKAAIFDPVAARQS